MQTKGIIIAGLAGGSGKSVAAVGLTAYLVEKGLNVVPFKKGPDYIDAGWLALAAGRKSYNLDPYLMDDETIRSSFLKYSRGADVVVVEGNRGLYDGVNASGGYSTAELAISLRLPVILVVNCTKTTRTVAAMVLGCKLLDERLDIRGVILNHIATKRQSTLISEAVIQATGIPVLGVIPRLQRDIFPMRHLGMIPYQEYSGTSEALAFLAQMFRESVQTEALEKVMAEISMPAEPVASVSMDHKKAHALRIGVLQDAAFQFYYAENLEALENEGARLIPINALSDAVLPELDGLYIGGGFPETSARELAANHSFRRSLHQAVQGGLPVYAECGGLIYLGESIEIDGREYELTGVFPVRFGMSTKPQAHGYSIFVAEKENPYYRTGTRVKGHEFRYSTIREWWGNEADLVLKMERGQGFSGGRDGLQHKNTLALYTHVHVGGTPEWVKGFMDCCRKWAKES